MNQVEVKQEPGSASVLGLHPCLVPGRFSCEGRIGSSQPGSVREEQLRADQPDPYGHTFPHPKVLGAPGPEL